MRRRTLEEENGKEGLRPLFCAFTVTNGILMGGHSALCIMKSFTITESNTSKFTVTRVDFIRGNWPGGQTYTITRIHYKTVHCNEGRL